MNYSMTYTAYRHNIKPVFWLIAHEMVVLISLFSASAMKTTRSLKNTLLDCVINNFSRLNGLWVELSVLPLISPYAIIAFSPALCFFVYRCLTVSFFSQFILGALTVLFHAFFVLIRLHIRLAFEGVTKLFRVLLVTKATLFCFAIPYKGLSVSLFSFLTLCISLSSFFASYAFGIFLCRFLCLWGLAILFIIGVPALFARTTIAIRILLVPIKFIHRFDFLALGTSFRSMCRTGGSQW